MKPTWQQIKHPQKKCGTCKHAISSSDKVYCGKLREVVDPIEPCTDFELEPAEYTTYRRM
jgi:hypothetical protein